MQHGIEHRSADCSLKPLISALEHYINEYNKNLEKSDEDYAALDTIWIEEVGRAQRDLPAHLVHEYCHPDRSFDEVAQDKSLLDESRPFKRQLHLNNWNTGNYEPWFTPDTYLHHVGLGFSFGVLRGEDAAAIAGSAVGREAAREDDLAAIRVIEEVRTLDRKQSLKNLSQASNDLQTIQLQASYP
jgi:hypothetical protein